MTEEHAELVELMDAEIFVEGADNPSEEQHLLKSLEGNEGISELSVVQGRVAVRYDPTKVTKADIVQRISGSGFKIKEVDSAAASPITDTVPPT